jgi:cytoskeletal protein CcmA (bactofilin family)
VRGTITVRELVILKTARIEGDVHYEALTIEQGAQVDGKFAPDAAKPRALRRRRRCSNSARTTSSGCRCPLKTRDYGGERDWP